MRKFLSLLVVLLTTFSSAWADTKEYVNLGLPSGLLWATCNVGATTPQDYGDYFAWGATTPYYAEGHSQDNPCSNWISGKTGYDWASDPFNGGNSEYSETAWNSAKSTAIDANNNLLAANDAATANWACGWRMPTSADFLELAGGCFLEWTDDYKSTGVKGIIVYKNKNTTGDGDKGYFLSGTTWKKLNGTSYSDGTQPSGYVAYTTSDTHIFLPAAGYRVHTYLKLAGSYGSYWSSSLNSSDPSDAFYLYFGSDNVQPQISSSRFFGPSVRPVLKPSSVAFATSSITMDALAEQEVKINLSKVGKALSSLQMNITLPDGTSYVDGSATLGTMADDAELSFMNYEGTNKYNVQILTNNQKEFTGDDSDILTFKIKANKSMTSQKINLTTVIGSTTTAEKVAMPDMSADITVNKIDPGFTFDKGTKEKPDTIYMDETHTFSYTTSSTGDVTMGAYDPTDVETYITPTLDKAKKTVTISATTGQDQIKDLKVEYKQAATDVYNEAKDTIYLHYIKIIYDKLNDTIKVAEDYSKTIDAKYESIKNTLTDSIESAKALVDHAKSQEQVDKKTHFLNIAYHTAIFDIYADTVNTAMADQAREGDSQACKDIISNAQAALKALKYDEGKTPEANKEAQDALNTKLTTDLLAQRREDFKNKKAEAIAIFEDMKAEEKDDSQTVLDYFKKVMENKINSDIDHETAYDDSKTPKQLNDSIDNYVKVYTDTIRAQRVIDWIEWSKPIDLTPECAKKLIRARNGYEALTEEQNTIVKNANYDKQLTDALAEVFNYYRETANGKYGTICLPFPFKAAEGAELYVIDSMKDGDIKLAKVDYAVAGYPYIYLATDAKQHFAYIEDWGRETIADNGMERNNFYGTYITYYAQNYEFVFDETENQFVKVTSGYKKVAGHTCYIYFDKGAELTLDEKTLNAKALTISFDGGMATGINEVQGSMSNVQSSEGKYIKDGRIIIIKADKQYTTAGQQIK